MPADIRWMDLPSRHLRRMEARILSGAGATGVARIGLSPAGLPQRGRSLGQYSRSSSSRAWNRARCTSTVRYRERELELVERQRQIPAHHVVFRHVEIGIRDIARAVRGHRGQPDLVRCRETLLNRSSSTWCACLGWFARSAPRRSARSAARCAGRVERAGEGAERRASRRWRAA